MRSFRRRGQSHRAILLSEIGLAPCPCGLFRKIRVGCPNLSTSLKDAQEGDELTDTNHGPITLIFAAIAAFDCKLDYYMNASVFIT